MTSPLETLLDEHNRIGREICEASGQALKTIHDVLPLSFSVRGIPRTQGSMRAFMPKGARFPVVTHGDKNLTIWRNLISMEARQVAPQLPWTEACAIELVFYVDRPKFHYSKKGLRASAPKLPSGSKRDIDKLVRAVLDSLTSIFYKDDGQVCEIAAKKVFADDRGAGVDITLRKLES